MKYKIFLKYFNHNPFLFADPDPVDDPANDDGGSGDGGDDDNGGDVAGAIADLTNLVKSLQSEIASIKNPKPARKKSAPKTAKPPAQPTVPVDEDGDDDDDDPTLEYKQQLSAMQAEISRMKTEEINNRIEVQLLKDFTEAGGQPDTFRSLYKLIRNNVTTDKKGKLVFNDDDGNPIKGGLKTVLADLMEDKELEYQLSDSKVISAMIKPTNKSKGSDAPLFSRGSTDKIDLAKLSQTELAKFLFK